MVDGGVGGSHCVVWSVLCGSDKEVKNCGSVEKYFVVVGERVDDLCCDRDQLVLL